MSAKSDSSDTDHSDWVPKGPRDPSTTARKAVPEDVFAASATGITKQGAAQLQSRSEDAVDFPFTEEANQSASIAQDGLLYLRPDPCGYKIPGKADLTDDERQLLSKVIQAGNSRTPEQIGELLGLDNPLVQCAGLQLLEDLIVWNEDDICPISLLDRLGVLLNSEDDRAKLGVLRVLKFYDTRLFSGTTIPSRVTEYMKLSENTNVRIASVELCFYLAEAEDELEGSDMCLNELTMWIANAANYSSTDEMHHNLLFFTEALDSFQRPQVHRQALIAFTVLMRQYPMTELRRDVQESALQAAGKELGDDAEILQSLIDAVPKLVALTTNRDLYVRQTAVEAIGILVKYEGLLPSLKEAVSKLLDLTTDSDWIVRRTAIKAIGILARYGGVRPLLKEAVPKLIHLTSDSDGTVQQGAIRTILILAKYKEMRPLLKEAVPKLSELTTDSDRTVRRSATQTIEIMAKYKEMLPLLKEAVPKLIDRTTDSDWTVRRAAIQTIETMAKYEEMRPLLKEAVPKLSDLVTDSDWTVQRAAIQTIETMAKYEEMLPLLKEAVPKLIDRTTDSDWTVRRAAIQTIETMAKYEEMQPLLKEAVPKLIDKTTHWNQNVRQGAIEAIGTLGKYGVVAVDKGSNTESEASDNSPKSIKE